MEDSRLLGDYRLIKQIGQGSMGSAFVAEQRFTKKKYVLKVLPEELAQDRAFMQRFEEEVELLAELDHPNIVKIYNVSFAQGVYFLVCDCIVDDMGETTNLSDFFKNREKKLSQQEVLTIAQQLASALDYGHSCKLAHRGIKLNNILIQAKNNQPGPLVPIRVSDWGLSKIVGVGASLMRTFKGMAEALSISALTQQRYPQPAIETAKLTPLHQTLIQNFAFLAPEQKRLEVTADTRVDSFAFGVLLYYLLMREYPEGAFDLPSSRLADCIVDWDLLVKECLKPNPNDRPQLLQELLAKATISKFVAAEVPEATKLQEAPKLQEAVVAVAPKPPEQSRSPWVREEKIVKEYAPEKRESLSVQPILTEMVMIQGGEYERGSLAGCRDEMPRHKVYLKPFAIDVHPVTNEQFVRFLEYLGQEKDSHNHDTIRLRDSRIKKSAGRYSIEPGYNKHPVVGVTWYGAVAYCQWVGKRLPTEVEWEVACCGGLENPLYPTGESIEKTQANFFSSDTTAVMSYPPNGYGLYDLAGNVYEWCHDWYEYNFYELSNQEPENPKGPLQGVYRVLRGGCWKSLKEDLRATKRHRNNPGAANGTYGFRCAADSD